MVNYDNLWNVMKKRNMTKTQLRRATNLSSSTFAKLSKNDMIALEVLTRLCNVLECQISDICYVDNVKRKENVL